MGHRAIGSRVSKEIRDKNYDIRVDDEPDETNAISVACLVKHK
jgi:hypothetical protein